MSHSGHIFVAAKHFVPDFKKIKIHPFVGMEEMKTAMSNVGHVCVVVHFGLFKKCSRNVHHLFGMEEEISNLVQ